MITFLPRSLRLFAARAALMLVTVGLLTLSSEAAAGAEDITAEFAGIQSRIKQKLAGGDRTAEALAPEIAEIDALLAKHPEKTEAGAKVAFAKAMLYAQVIGDATKAQELLNQLKDRYEGTKIARDVARRLSSGSGSASAAAPTIGKPAPEIVFDWSSRPELKKLSDLKGRVVVLDFWATWCGPCISSFPQVREHVEHFRGSPVTVLGVTSIQGAIITKDRKRVDLKGDPEKERAMMADYVKDMDMTWDVVVRQGDLGDGYNVRGIPHVTIIDPAGNVRYDKLHPKSDAKKIAEHVTALLKEFELPVPAEKVAAGE